MTDEEFAQLSEWEREEWFREIQPIMDALLAAPRLVICDFAPIIFDGLMAGDDS